MSNRRPLWSFLVLALGLSLIVSNSEAQQCEPNGLPLDFGCAGCVTTVSMMCSSAPGECAGCSYIWTAGISCSPGMGEYFGNDGQVDCDDGFEWRLGGCNGQLWAAVICNCLSCPE